MKLPNFRDKNDWCDGSKLSISKTLKKKERKEEEKEGKKREREGKRLEKLQEAKIVYFRKVKELLVRGKWMAKGQKLIKGEKICPIVHESD